MTTANDTTAALETPDTVLQLLREQASMYGSLESLASAQRSLVTGDDAGPLLSLLADRQKLSDGLARLAGRLAPVRRDWSSYHSRFTPGQREEADRLVDEASARLQRVIERDEQDAHILSGRKQMVARALRATQSTRQAISAYRVPNHGSGRLDCVNEGC